ncbi:Aldo/keto reductase [Ramaria rubella]|nr:Aldo/keto reductase [Ramaria rubella]
MTVHTRQIGNSKFSAIGFGAMTISASYVKADMSDDERLEVLDRAYELGCRHWDTADVYLASEELIGKWFQRTGKRDEIFLASKFGLGGERVRGDAAYIKEAIEKSLKKLQTDHIDLYYAHRVDKETPIEVTVGAMAELVKAGKVRHLGLSECSSDGLRRAHAVHPIAAVQVEYSPFVLAIEDPKISLLKTARELGVKIVAYSPLGRGFLTGQIKSVDDLEDNDFRKRIPLYRENFPKILALSDHLKAIGAKHGGTAGQAALAWLLAQGDDIIPIPGTKSVKYLEENIAAAKIALTTQDIKEIRDAIGKAGLTNTSERYPPGMTELLFVDSPPLKK